MEINRQYIGARYVPKFYEGSNGTEWDENHIYDPLTIVTYLGNSYTSKKSVPAAIGNPMSNPEYWAATGNYNAQVEQYRQDTLRVEEKVETVEPILDAVVTPEMFGAVGDGVSDDTQAIQDAINTNKRVLLEPYKNYKVTNLTCTDGIIEGNNSTITISGSITKTNQSGKLTFKRVRFVADGNNPLFTGYLSWLYAEQCDFNDFDVVMLQSLGTFVGFSTFVECFFNRGNTVMQSSVSLNAITFYKCSFSDIGDIAFKCSRYEAMNFDSCTFASCDVILGSYLAALCKLDSVSFTSCYFETNALLDDSKSYAGNAGYYAGNISFFGGFYNSPSQMINIVSPSSAYNLTLFIRGLNFVQASDGVINLTEKVFGEIEAIGALNTTKVTGEHLNIRQIGNDTVYNSAKVSAPSLVPTTNDTTRHAIGVFDTYHLPTWGCDGGASVLLPTIAAELTLAQLKALTYLPYICIGFDRTTHKTYIKYGSDWYDMSGNAV